ncbi:MAG TPA: PA14 domain-containing protein [Polyangia bacterium]|nr:PA14 domain-containing protein [Polyangia bacterium]
MAFAAVVPACADLDAEDDGSGTALSTGTGLQADYFNNQTLTAPAALRRTDATVNFNWGTGSPGAGVGVDHFSARWTGQVEALFTQTYTFFTTSDDGVRLWVNGQQIINNWTDHGPTENSGTIALSAGQRYDLRLEFYENGGGATVTLSWASSSQPKQIVPRAQLYPPSSGSTNVALAGTAFRWSANASATSNGNRVAAPALNDNSTAAEIDLAGSGDDPVTNAWEAAGVAWSAPQAGINRVEFVNGSTDGPTNGNGNFTANFRLQLSADGATWTDAGGWTLAPPYPFNATASNQTYTFTGPATTARGVRVTGQVRTAQTSWHARAREVRAWSGTSGGGTGGSGGSGSSGSSGSTGSGGTTGTAGTTGNAGTTGTGGGTTIPTHCTSALPAGAQPTNVANPTTVVGTGTAASCTFTALSAAVTRGGVITFNCGAAPVTIAIASTMNLPTGVDTVIDGGNRITLDGRNAVQILRFDHGDFMVNNVRVTLQHLTLINGKTTPTQVIPTAPAPCSQGFNDGQGGALYMRDGNLTIVDCTFTHNQAAPLGPDTGGGAIYVLGSKNGVIIAGSVFTDNHASNAGAVGGLFAQLAIYNSLFQNNSATGNGANSNDPSRCSFINNDQNEIGSGGNGGAIYQDGGNATNVILCGVDVVNNAAGAGAFGGGVFMTSNDFTGTMTVQDSIITGNTGGSWTQVKEGSVTNLGTAFGVNAKSATVQSSTLQGR